MRASHFSNLQMVERATAKPTWTQPSRGPSRVQRRPAQRPFMQRLRRAIYAALSELA